MAAVAMCVDAPALPGGIKAGRRYTAPMQPIESGSANAPGAALSIRRRLPACRRLLFGAVAIVTLATACRGNTGPTRIVTKDGASVVGTIVEARPDGVVVS